MRREVVFVIDGSGSMGNKAADVRGGFNTYIEELKKEKDAEYSISATVFNTSVFPLFTQRPLGEVPALTEQNYLPGGGTALYDAIADTVDAIKDAHYCSQCGKGRVKSAKFCSDCGEQLNGDSIFTVIIMTDGEENSSQKFRKHHIVTKIQGKEKLGNWTFVYMGANQDAMKEGNAIGIQSGNAINYNTGSTLGTFAAVATSTSANYNSFATTGTTTTADWAGTGTAAGVNWNTVNTPTPTQKTVPLAPHKKRQKKNV